MVKNHMKRLAMPKTWKFSRKKTRWVTKPNAGAHGYDRGIALETVMKELIKCSHSRKETKSILHRKEVLVDGKRRRDLKLPVGLMDVVSLPEINEHYRIMPGKKGEIKAVPIKKDESSIKPCKITGKTMIKKSIIQINLFDSRNIILKKGEKSPYKVGDTLVISFPKQEIKDHLKLEKGSFAYLTGGKHIGKRGKIEDIKGNVLSFKTNEGSLLETEKKYAYVVGKDKPIISLT